MSIYVFGNQESIVVPNLQNPQGRLSDFFHTHPSYDDFYSPYGYAHPLTMEGVPLHLLLDAKIPVQNSIFRIEKQIHAFLLVDHEGRLWKISVGYFEEKDHLQVHQNFIHPSFRGWWLIPPVVEEADSTFQMLLGFLRAQPSVEAINDFCYKYHQARVPTWLTIDFIVKRLNELYPKPKNKLK